MTTIKTIVRKSIACGMALLTTLAPLGPGVYAAPTVLSDIPIAAKVAAKPNLLFTLDDSGSMMLNYIPDYTITGPGVAAPNNLGPGYCRETNGITAAGCNSDFAWGRDVPMFASEFNRLYYNPDINYDPPVDGAGNQATYAAPDGLPGITIYKYMTSAKTTGWTAVTPDAYLGGAPSNLINTVAVAVYCNTDWPTDNPVNLASVGDANGEYSPTAGRDCRINGTAYDALAGAPAVIDDYSYPYNKTSGGNDPKYFYRNGGNRQIWCKTGLTTGWPRTCVDNYITCSGTVTVTPPVAQTCFYQSDATTVGAPYTYSPAGCSTNPAYQWTWAAGGCVGTIGVECLACNRTGTTTVTGKNGRCRLASSGAPGSGGSNAVCNCAGIGCTLPACPNFDPPDTCSGSWSQTCTPNGSANCSTPYFGGGGTLLSDANGAGVTCRRNNSTGSYISSRFTYPETLVVDATKYNRVVNDGSCGAITATVNIPRHYYTVASVQFCDSTISTANDPWRGFGTGTCQAKNDLNLTNKVKYGKFTRVNLVTGRTYNYTDPFTGIAGTRTYAEEMSNYANWWAYYRTRILAAKTTTAIAFNIVDNKYRAGFHVMNASLTNWLDAGDFVSGAGLHREQWYNKLFATPITGGSKTPTLDALIRIGQLVEVGAGAVAGLPAHTDPIPLINSNPVTCTNNYHILFTDGFTDQLATPTVVGERDGTSIPARGAIIDGVPALPVDPGVAEPSRTLSGLNPLVGGAWPNPFKDVPVATANSLADISLYYWMRDLRPTLLNDVPSADGRAGKDLDWKKDPAWWQHVNFSALSYGAEGLLDAVNRPTVEAAIAAGTKPWFTTPNYPNPPHNSPWPTTNRRATTADDLWHAAVNGRGKFAFAQTPIEVAYGLGSIISGIGNNSVARVGATFAARDLNLTNNFIYIATVEPGWSGELKKITIDPTTGAQGVQRWAAGVKLDTLLATPAAGTSPVLDSDNTWFTSRRIVTRNVDAGAFSVVPFTYAGLSAGTTQLATLASTALQQQKIIAYLRGGSTFGAGPSPALIEGTAIGQFRERTGKLGNISDSKPVVVGPADKPYIEATDYGYAAYKAANATRPLRVFVGANDGMFHVFNGEDDSGLNTGGTEMFAYVPSGVYTSAFDEGGKARKGIQALTFQDGGAPIFKHHFYVNGAPRAADVDFANCGSNTACTPDWRSIVVSGLGKGGNTYFAIDATTTAVANETAAASKILWEYALPNSQFSYGNPLIAKTRAYGWVVIIASGYNNAGDGKGHLYVLNASTGALLRTLNTTAADTGSVGSPSGLTKIRGFVKNDANQVLEQIYGGDLNGRLWRWDVSDADATLWQAKTVLLATLTDPASAPQPITTGPEIEIDLNNGVDRFVFIGTGRLLDAEDLTTPSPEQIQTMYAIRDGSLDTPLPAGSLPINARTALTSISGILGLNGAAAPNGWKHDLPLGQRIVVDTVAEFNLVGYAGTVLQPDPCLTSLPAYIYGRDYVSAESLVYDDFGANQDSIYSAEGAVGLDIITIYDPTLSFPSPRLAYSKGTATGGIKPIVIKPKTFGGGHRLSWRILGD